VQHDNEEGVQGIILDTFLQAKTRELTNTRTDDIKAKKTTPNGVVFPLIKLFWPYHS